MKKPLLFWLLFLVLVELGVRAVEISARGPRGFLLPPPGKTGAMLTAPNPEIGFLLPPEHDRSGGYGSPGARLKILCAGNSNIFGHGLEENQTFPYLLSKTLADSGVDAYVVNVGVPGYTARNIRARIESAWESGPFDFVIFTAGWNDLHSASVSDRVRGLVAPGPPGGALGRVGIFRLADRALEWLVPLVLAPDTWSEERLDEVPAEVNRIAAYCRAKDATAIALDLPSGLAPGGGTEVHGSAEPVVWPPIRRFTPEGYRRLLEALLLKYRGAVEREGIPLVKCGLEYEVPWEEKKFLILDQCHPGPKGNKMIAEKVANVIVSNRRNRL